MTDATEKNIYHLPIKESPREFTQKFLDGTTVTVKSPDEDLTVGQIGHLLEYTKYLLLERFSKGD